MSPPGTESSPPPEPGLPSEIQATANDITPRLGLKSPHVRGPVSFSLCHLTTLPWTWALSLLPEGERLQERQRGRREGEQERGQEQAEVVFVLVTIIPSVPHRG